MALGLGVGSQGRASQLGPLDGRTLAPPESSTCTGGPAEFCHVDFELDSGPGMVEIQVPQSYAPGEMYEISVHIAQSGQIRWGFELTVIDEEGAFAGDLIVTDAVNTQESFFANLQRWYMKHTFSGTALGTPDENSWTFAWQAPGEDVGTVTFYAAGNAADGNGVNTNANPSLGDFIYTTSVAVPVSEPGTTGGALAALGTLGWLAAARWRARHRCGGQPVSPRGARLNDVRAR
jgi:hypothetical protein